MDDSTQKVMQYLGEAHASEQALTRVLQSQIAMTPRGSYRRALETHLDETRDHAQRVQRRLRALGGSQSPIVAIGRHGVVRPQGDRGALKLALDGADIRESILDEGVQRVVRRETHLLPEEAEASRPDDDARVGRLDPGQDAQQRGLAGAVLTDQAEPGTRTDRQRDIGEDAPLAVAQRDAVDTEGREGE